MSAQKLVAVDIGVTPEASVSGAVLLQTEGRAFLTFNAMRETSTPCPNGGFYRERVGTAVVELLDCSITKFGYPNDEAWSAIPLTRSLECGVYEVEGTSWKQELIQLNKFAFPKTDEWAGKHFVFLFHDSSFECIARELRVEISREPWEQLFSKIAARAFG